MCGQISNIVVFDCLTMNIFQVNNAAINFNVGDENSVDNAKLVISTNYYGIKSMTRAMIPLMKRSTAGARIVNVSSRLGRVHGKRNVSKFHF